MDWFTGDVGAAIAAAKARQTLFVVFVTGDDEPSKKMLDIVNQESTADQYKEFVCVKIDQGSPTFNQFSQIYPVLLVPSIFYVDSSTGVDIEVTVAISGEETVLAGLDRAKDKFQADKTETATTTTTSTSAASASAIPKPDIGQEDQNLESRVSRARTMLNENVGTLDSEVASHNTPTSIEDRVERARRLMNQRKEQKAKEETEKEKEKERERRELGKTLTDQKREREEEDMREAAKERRKDKEEEKLAKERVKAAIEQDRADRAMRYQAEKSEADERRKEKERKALAERAAAGERAAADRATISRIQFRLPDGRTQTHQFEASAPLETVYAWVTSDLETSFTDFSLSTTFPRRELDTEPKSASLKELQLAPSATILVMPKGTMATSDGSLMSLLMLLLTPFSLLWGLLSSFFNSSPGAASSSSQPTQPSASDSRSAAAARQGNIGRLRSSERDDDENNTYNGNSTQQM